MSLKEVVLEIAKDMETEAALQDSIGNNITASTMRNFSKQLTRAVKAAGDDKPSVDPTVFLAMGAQLDNKAKAIVDKQKERQTEDAVVTGDSMSLCVGGGSDGDYVPISPGMPKGAFTRVEGQMYKLKDDGKLYYTPEAMDSV